jgi:DNA-binding FadR family transcriptional regulator
MGRHIADRDVFLGENDRFHSLLAFASGNPIFGHLQSALHWITDGTVLGVEYPERRRKDVLRAHDRICTAIEARDTDAARQLMTLHMENFRAYLERNYPEMLQRQLSWSDFAE